jgi:transcriptional regulator with XRE-family HTH domain
MKSNTAKQVADRVRVHRAALRISQKELGTRAGLATLTVQRVESGHYGASIKTLDKLSAALGLTTAELIGGEYLTHTDPTNEKTSPASEVSP